MTLELCRDEAEIERYRQPYVTDDPFFGLLNRGGALEDILDGRRIAASEALSSDAACDNR